MKVVDNHWAYVDLADGSKVMTHNYNQWTCSPLCMFCEKDPESPFFGYKCTKFNQDLYDLERLDECISMEAI